nr:hypothetical protein [Pseudomonas sp. HS-2]
MNPLPQPLTHEWERGDNSHPSEQEEVPSVSKPVPYPRNGLIWAACRLCCCLLYTSRCV